MEETQTPCDTAVQIKTPTEAEYKKYSFLLVLAAYLVYVASMVTKMVYSVELVEIIAYLGITKAESGWPLAVHYIVYGVAQVLFALYIRKIPLKKFYTVTTVMAAVVVVFCGVFASMPTFIVVYALLGFLECGSWGGTLHFITLYVRPEKQTFSLGILATGYSVGNLISYLISFVSVSAGSWRYAFFFGGAFLLAMILFFFLVLSRVEKVLPENKSPIKEKPAAEKEMSSRRRMSSRCVICLTVAVIGSLICTSLQSAAANYLPMLLFDVHGLPSKYSILISTLMPVFITAGPFIVTAVTARRGTFISRSGLILLIAAAAPLLLIPTYDKSIVAAVLFGSLYAMLTRGVTMGYLTVAPLHMDDEMPVSAFSAIANVGGSAACAMTPVLFGWMLDTMGWGESYIILLSLTLLLAAIHGIGVLLMRRTKR